MPTAPQPEFIKFLGDIWTVLIEKNKADIEGIFRGSNFLYEREHDLRNILEETFFELLFLVNQFEVAQTELLTKASSCTEYLIKEMKKIPPDQGTPENVITEFLAIDLSTYFKAFLVASKSVLDKLVPIYSYRFAEKLRQFDDRGKKLVKNIKKSKKSFRKNELVELIEKARQEWLDSLITLRDQYTHYSNLKEFRNFWLSLDEWKGDFSSLKDLHNFNKPTIEVGGQSIHALDYMLMIKSKLASFLGDFLRLCEFTPDRRPKISLRCIECDHVFAKTFGNYPQGGEIKIMDSSLDVIIKDQARGYGRIICPKCGAKTDTDLSFWPTNCFQSKTKY